MGRGDCAAQHSCKIGNQLVTHRVPQRIVGLFQIIQVKDNTRHRLMGNAGIRKEQLAAPLVGQPGMLIDKRLLLQLAVFPPHDHGLHRLDDYDDNQQRHVRHRCIFQRADGIGNGLGIFLRSENRPIRHTEIFFAQVYNNGGGIAILANPVNFFLQLLPQRNLLIQIRQIVFVRQLHQTVFPGAVAQAVGDFIQICNQVIILLAYDFQLDFPLGYASDQPRIVQHSRRSLQAVNPGNHAENQNCHQND